MIKMRFIVGCLLLICALCLAPHTSTAEGRYVTSPSRVRALVADTRVILFNFSGEPEIRVDLTADGGLWRRNRDSNRLIGRWKVDGQGRLHWRFPDFPSSTWLLGWLGSETILFSAPTREPSFRACVVGRAGTTARAFGHWQDWSNFWPARACRRGTAYDWGGSGRGHADEAYDQPTTRRSGCRDSERTILSVQNALYKLGYPLSKIDGVYGPRTNRAVEIFRRNYRLGTADLCRVLAIAREVEPPQRWLAVGFTADGRYSAAWNHESRRSAERAVRRDFRSRTKVTSVAGDRACVALSFGRRGRRYGTYSAGAVGSDSRSALHQAFSACEADGYACRHVVMYCESGEQ